MAEKITIAEGNTSIIFSLGNVDNDLLIIGNIVGAFGTIKGNLASVVNTKETLNTNFLAIFSAISSNHKVYYVGDEDSANYLNDFMNTLVNMGWIKKTMVANLLKVKIKANPDANVICEKKCTAENNIPYMSDKLYESLRKMKFDYIIQNPPYSKSLHLDFLELGMKCLSDKGKMVIIEPATWLINVRKNGKTKKYDSIKKKLEGHIESVVIENLNKEFGTGLYVPFATTTIDMSKTFDTIDCTICGEHKAVNSIYDVNLVGNYATIWSILDKVQKYGDMMSNHTTKEDMGRDYWYAKYAELTPDCGCSNTSDRKGLKYEGDYLWRNTHNGDINIGYIYSAFHTYNNEISDAPLCAYDRGKHLTDKVTDNIYGTKSELENWKHFIFNNKLPLFINIVMTIDQHNNSKEFLPWLVDKQYTDEEINKMFGFTDEEIKLIDTTIKKYERNSPWFKRYMCGSDAVSDEEVNNFIAEISK